MLTLVVAPARNESGIALVIVLWIVTLMAIMAGGFAYTMRTETTLTTFTMERSQARALAEAAIAYASMKVMLQPQADDLWPIEGSTRQWRFGSGERSGEVSIAVVDSSGKVDINHADRRLLGGLLSNNGVDEADLESLLDAIEDWRDPDDLKRLQGAEDEEYLSAGRQAGPKNAPFESITELQQVLGIDPQLYERLADHITVAGHKGINPQAASLAVLSAIPDIDLAAVTEYVQQRTESIEQELPLPPPPPLGAYLAKARGLAYHISVEAILATGTKTAITATVTQARRPGQAYHIIAWDEG